MQVPAPAALPTCKAHESFASWLFRKAEKQYNKAYQVFLNVYGLYTIANDLIHIPKLVHTGAKALGYFGVIDLVFAGPRLISTIKSFGTSKDFWSHANAMLMTASEVSNLYSQFVLVVDGLKEINLLSVTSFSWASKVSYIFMPLQFIFLGQAIEQARSINQLRLDFQDHYKDSSTEVQCLHNVLRGLQFVQEREERLQSTLLLSKKCQLQDRSRYLLQRINAAQEDKSELIKEGEEFLGILHSRICTRCTLESANIVISVASTIFGAIGMLFVPNPITATLFAVITISGIILGVADALLLDKNPFKPSANIWQTKIIHPIRQSVRSVSSILYGLFSAPCNLRASSC